MHHYYYLWFMLLGGTWSQWGETGRKRKLNFKCFRNIFVCVSKFLMCDQYQYTHICDHINIFAVTHDDSLAFLHLCKWSLSFWLGLQPVLAPKQDVKIWHIFLQISLGRKKDRKGKIKLTFSYLAYLFLVCIWSYSIS